MKTAEELLKEKGITPETIHHNYAYVYRVVCEVIGEAQKEAYNQALEDAALLGTAKFEMLQSGDHPVYEYVLVVNSILKLKK